VKGNTQTRSPGGGACNLQHLTVLPRTCLMASGPSLPLQPAVNLSFQLNCKGRILMFFVTVGAMFWLSPSLTLLMLTVVPPVSLGAVFYGRYLKRLSNKTQEALGDMSKVRLRMHLVLSSLLRTVSGSTRSTLCSSDCSGIQCSAIRAKQV
jgi:ABC-type multidrug transport system fused ATPase/permease subunit